MSKRSDPDGYSGSDMALFCYMIQLFCQKNLIRKDIPDPDPDQIWPFFCYMIQILCQKNHIQTDIPDSDPESGSDMAHFLLNLTSFMSKRLDPVKYSGPDPDRYGPCKSYRLSDPQDCLLGNWKKASSWVAIFVSIYFFAFKAPLYLAKFCPIWCDQL